MYAKNIKLYFNPIKKSSFIGYEKLPLKFRRQGIVLLSTISVYRKKGAKKKKKKFLDPADVNKDSFQSVTTCSLENDPPCFQMPNRVHPHNKKLGCCF
jgi:hypothetical protein